MVMHESLMLKIKKVIKGRESGSLLSNKRRAFEIMGSHAAAVQRFQGGII